MTDAGAPVGAVLSDPPGRRGRVVVVAAIALVVAVVAVVVAVIVTRPHPARPAATADAYLTAWSHQDWTTMELLVDHPPADFATVHQQMVTDLQVLSADYEPGPVQTHGATAQVAYTARLTLNGIGPWTTSGTLHLRQQGHWQIEWTPATIVASLPAGGRLTRDRTWSPRADILGSGGVPLTGAVGLVSIGVQGSAIQDPAQITTAMTAAGATAAQVATALTQARAHPDQFVAVFDVTDQRYQQVRPAIYPIPGTRFVRHTTVGALTADLAAHVVGTLGPVTAEQLKTLGRPYLAGDMVGQSGIELADERQLAGTPGGDIKVVDAQGHALATVATFAPHPGTPVRTTLDLATQQAAEQALNGVAQPAALVAVRASTGDVLAVVSRPTATPFDRALDGQYPPGSTFKIITSTALLTKGLTPDSPATCPPTITVDGRSFHNFEGEAQPSLPLHRAFAESCNTAFIGLADGLAGSDLVTAAGQFGFGTPIAMGLSAFGGQVPVPADAVDKAATAIGQGRVVASPLMMATVAATVDAGATHPPRLIVGAADDTAASHPVAPTVVAGLRTMMAEVVSSGTGAPAALPGSPPVYGKTGTAEFGTANPPATHAWFIGYRGDIAFAVIVEGGGVGGPVAAPLAAKFLEGL